MDKKYVSKYLEEENSHWWFIARRNIILQLVKQAHCHRDDAILEVGCSGGPLLRDLHKAHFTNTTGIDVDSEMIMQCKKNDISHVFTMQGEKTSFKDDQFDLIIASDVLEHIQNDQDALSEWYRILKPDGKLIIFVPAFDFLWSAHDVSNQHFRRYSKVQLIRKIEIARFTVMLTSYWNFILFFPVSVLCITQRFLSINEKDHLIHINKHLNRILIRLLKLENRFLSSFKFPFGISLYTICKKTLPHSEY